MERYNVEQQQLLLESEGGAHVSIFLPLPQKPIEAKTDAIRLDNLIRETRNRLTEHWMTAREADLLLEPLHEADFRSLLCADRREGLAIYRSADLFKVFPLSEALRIDPWCATENGTDMLSVSRSFRVRPMLETRVHLEEPCYLLTVSKKSVRLFRIESGAITECDVLKHLEGFEESLVHLTADRGEQVHSGGVGTTGKQRAVFHGQGGLTDAEKTEFIEYLRHVDDVVKKRMGDEGCLLILAGVDSSTSLYRQINAYPRLASTAISGNVDHLTAEELQERAMPIMDAEAARMREIDANQIREQVQGRAATDPEQVLCAAHEGRIDVLFIDAAATLYGSFDVAARTLRELKTLPTGTPGDSSHDLIEMALAETLRHGGHVYAVDSDQMPVDGKMAAALRY